jgi:micrococcal nuclease
MFNAILLLEGYAQVMTVQPNVKYVDYFLQYQREAMEAGRGLWGLAVYQKSKKKK